MKPVVKYGRRDHLPSVRDVPDEAGNILAETLPNLRWDHTAPTSLEAEGYEMSVALFVQLTRSVPERLHVSVKARPATGVPIYVDRFCEARDDGGFVGEDVVSVVRAVLDLAMARVAEV